MTQELLTLAFDLTGPVFQGIRCFLVQQQNNLSDCGVFSIAFATSLVYGQNPMNVTYNVSQMRPHLLNCLKGGIIFLSLPLELLLQSRLHMNRRDKTCGMARTCSWHSLCCSTLMLKIHNVLDCAVTLCTHTKSAL